MRSLNRPLRRGLAAALVVLHAGLTLAAGAHAGPHLEADVAWLPVDLHHHAYGFVAADSEAPRPLDPCVACQLSRLVPRLPVPAATLAAFPAPAVASLPLAESLPPATASDTHGPRAPPIA